MPAPFNLFEVFGVELEYMIVKANTLDVLPITDQLLTRAAAEPGAKTHQEDGSPVATEVELGPISWSNELALHVVEMKTTEPATTLDGLDAKFQTGVQRANALLAPLGGRLMPSAMHPWMDPFGEMKLWPHGYSDVYSAFNRIFDCRGHGWANLQSMHINLPFSGDAQFGRLHAAIRALLPIMPALSASSPIMDGRTSGLMDNRLEVYRNNAKKIPAAAGRVIPEPAYTEADYRREILEKIYREFAPHDPAGVLRHEWANSRGCIARFTRNAIEIRVLDVQECPSADLAIAQIITSVLSAICSGRLGHLDMLRRLTVDQLEKPLLETIRDGEQATISDREYLEALDAAQQGDTSVRVAEVWNRLIALCLPASRQTQAVKAWLEAWRKHGTLSRRILTETRRNDSRTNHARTFDRLATCLERGALFVPQPAANL